MYRAEPEVNSGNIKYSQAIDRLERILKFKRTTFEPRDDRQRYFLSLDIAALELAIAHFQQADKS